MAVMPSYHSGKCTNPTWTTAANSCTLPATSRQAQQQSVGIPRHSATEMDEEEVRETSHYLLEKTDSLGYIMTAFLFFYMLQKIFS